MPELEQVGNSHMSNSERLPGGHSETLASWVTAFESLDRAFQ